MKNLLIPLLLDQPHLTLQLLLPLGRPANRADLEHALLQPTVNQLVEPEHGRLQPERGARRLHHLQPVAVAYLLGGQQQENGQHLDVLGEAPLQVEVGGPVLFQLFGQRQKVLPELTDRAQSLLLELY